MAAIDGSNQPKRSQEAVLVPGGTDASVVTVTGRRGAHRPPARQAQRPRPSPARHHRLRNRPRRASTEPAVAIPQHRRPARTERDSHTTYLTDREHRSTLTAGPDSDPRARWATPRAVKSALPILLIPLVLQQSCRGAGSERNCGDHRQQSAGRLADLARCRGERSGIRRSSRAPRNSCRQPRSNPRRG